MEASPDVIVAIATAPVPSGIGVLRLSGHGLADFCQKLTHRSLPLPRLASLRYFYDCAGLAIDQGLLIYFSAPASFTGEEVIEFQTHGSPVVLHELQAHCLACGARLAEPGEFTLRAYLNNRLDLMQVEAVSDLIHAESRQAAISATRSLNGEFRLVVHEMINLLVDHRVFLESHFDFSDEDVPDYHHSSFVSSIQSMISRLEALMMGVQRGLLLRTGKKVVLIGVPNVGKSSLLNYLTEEDHALVTPIPGTTRDVIKGYWVLEGIPLHLVDTAGIRSTDDLVELAGIERTWKEASQADIALVVVDAAQGITADDRAILEKLPRDICKVLIINKIDLFLNFDPDMPNWFVDEVGISAFFCVSARTGKGISELKRGIMKSLKVPDADDVFMVSERYLALLTRARDALSASLSGEADEMVAEDLQVAQRALQRVVGREYASDDLLGDIFSRFCIGK